MNRRRRPKVANGTIEVARTLGISPERLYYWEQLGIVRPKHVNHGIRLFREYSKGDVERARFVKNLVDSEGYQLSRAIDRLQGHLLMEDLES
jgi:DNA-binding transcriptional MerR regulator